jgi:hypothetical protein
MIASREMTVTELEMHWVSEPLYFVLLLYLLFYVIDQMLMLQLFQLLDVTGFDEVNIRVSKGISNHKQHHCLT